MHTLRGVRGGGGGDDDGNGGGGDDGDDGVIGGNDRGGDGDGTTITRRLATSSWSPHQVSFREYLIE